MNTSNVMEVLDHTGDFKIEWSADNDDQVKAARETFEKMKAKGYAAFRLTADHARAGQLREFDPTAERIIMVPQIRGG